MLAAFGSALAGGLAEGLVNKVFGGGTSVVKQQVAQEQLLNYQKRLQEDYDSKMIQRRVADAKAAGVSPMAALGMQPGSGFVGSTGSFDYQAANGDSGIGANVGRAIAAAADPMTRLNMRLMNAQIEGQELDNQYKASQIARVRGQLGPAMPGVTSRQAEDNSAPISLRGTNLDTGPLVDIDTVDSDSDPIGYLAARGTITAHDLKYMWQDLKNWWNNKVQHSRYSGRQSYFPEGR